MYHCLQGCKSETDGSMLFEAISFQSIHSFQILFACFLSDHRALGGVSWVSLGRTTEIQSIKAM